MGSGTTDLEVLNSEIIGIFRSGRITTLGDELFNMHMDLLFLRLVRRRSHAAFRTIIAHGKDTYAQEVALLLELMRWFDTMNLYYALQLDVSTHALIMVIHIACRPFGPVLSR